MAILEFKVNGASHQVVVEATTTLLEVLREKLMITSPKIGCNTGDCGSCSVLLDGTLIRSCITPAMVANHKEVTTLEGISPAGELDPLQKAFSEHHGSQCGFLHSRDDRKRQGAAERKPRAHQAGDQGSHVREPLPVHRIQEDPGVDRGGSRRNVRAFITQHRREGI